MSSVCIVFKLRGKSGPVLVHASVHSVRRVKRALLRARAEKRKADANKIELTTSASSAAIAHSEEVKAEPLGPPRVDARRVRPRFDAQRNVPITSDSDAAQDADAPRLADAAGRLPVRAPVAMEHAAGAQHRVPSVVDVAAPGPQQLPGWLAPVGEVRRTQLTYGSARALTMRALDLMAR